MVLGVKTGERQLVFKGTSFVTWQDSHNCPGAPSLVPGTEDAAYGVESLPCQ